MGAEMAVTRGLFEAGNIQIAPSLIESSFDLKKKETFHRPLATTPRQEMTQLAWMLMQHRSLPRSGGGYSSLSASLDLLRGARFIA